MVDFSAGWGRTSCHSKLSWSRSVGRVESSQAWKFSNSCPMAWGCLREGCSDGWEVKLDQEFYSLSWKLCLQMTACGKPAHETLLLCFS